MTGAQRIADLARGPRVLAAALGAVAFFVLLGAHPLRVGAIDWLMRSDPATHYLGWAFYRNGPWSAWLLGEAPDYLFPLGTSVALTDSLPLLAVPLRAVEGWLPRPFQFIGLWLLACFALQGVAGARLAERLGATRGQAVLTAALLVWFPALAWRFTHPSLGHASLCAHWLLLLAMTPLVTQDDDHGPAAPAALALVLASAVHTYLFLLVGAFVALGAARDLSRGQRPAWRALGGSMLASCAVLWSQGVFGRRVGQSPGGVGTYSANLDTFVNSWGASALLPALPTVEGQQEGYAYLGLGNLLLVAAAVGVSLRRAPSSPRRDGLRWLAAACGGFALLAVMPRLSLGTRVLFDLGAVTPVFDRALDHLRATGRFAWPLAYLAVIASVRALLRRLTPREATAVLAVAAALQVVDVLPAHARWRLPREVPWQPHDPTWRASAGDYRHLALFPPKFLRTACHNRYLPWPNFAAVAALAADLRWSINGGYSARPPQRAVEAYCREALRDVRAGALREDTVYVLTTGATLNPLLEHLPVDATCGRIDGLTVCVRGRDTALRRTLRQHPARPATAPDEPVVR